MAERKSGPVKPPVIDLKARDASSKAKAPEGSEAAAGGEALITAAGAGEEPGAPKRPAAAAKPAGKQASRAAASKPESKSAAASTAAAAAAAGSTQNPAAEDPVADKPKPASPSPPPPPRPQARLAMPWSAISIAALAGALLGAGLVYLLASWIALPAGAPPVDTTAPELEALRQRAAALEERYTALEERTVDTQVSLDATIAQLDGGLTELRGTVAALGEQIPEPVTDELQALEGQLQTLESRLDATAAGASSADAAALAGSLAGIQDDVAALASRVDDIDAQLAATDATIGQLDSRVDNVRSALAAQSATLGGAEIGPAVRLPLVVSGLETAFVTGRPYTTELQSLTTLLPELDVPPAIAAAAETGLPRPDNLARRFSDRVPAILAGRTGATTGEWTEDALEWAKALLALRPAGEVEGDSPEAVVSRLEAAIERHDFISAAALMDQLPEPMRVAADDLAADILLHAEAEAFVAGLRAQALAPPALEAPQ